MGNEDATLEGGAWSNLDPQRGEVLEVYMPSTDMVDPGGFWAAFLVFDKRILSDGSVLVEVRCMGCEDVDLFKKLQKRMNVRGEYLHLCLSTPCIITDDRPELNGAIHVTQLRRWEFRDIITADYISRSMRTQCRGWYVEIGDGVVQDGPPPRGGRTRKDKPLAGSKATPAKPEKPRKTPGLSEAAKERLKERLREVRERTLGTGAVREPLVISDGVETEEDSEEADGSDSVEDPYKRKDPPAFPPIPPLALAELKVKKESTVLKPAEKKSGRAKRKAAKMTEKDVGKVLATRENISKNWRRQLVDKAVLTAEVKSKEKHKGKRKKDAKAKKVKEALALILTGSSKTKKEKKKSKRKRWMRSDGVIESCSNSSEDSSEEEESSSSKSELDTPMKKRSRESPGSILAMLTSHVRDQLDQGPPRKFRNMGQP